MSHCPRFALSHSWWSTMASTAAMAAFSSRNRRSCSWGWRSTSRGKLDLELGLRGATHSGERQRCRRSSLLGLLEEFQQRSFHFWCPESELENGREAELSTSVHCGVSQPALKYLVSECLLCGLAILGKKKPFLSVFDPNWSKSFRNDPKW